MNAFICKPPQKNKPTCCRCTPSEKAANTTACSACLPWFWGLLFLIGSWGSTARFVYAKTSTDTSKDALPAVDSRNQNTSVKKTAAPPGRKKVLSRQKSPPLKRKDLSKKGLPAHRVNVQATKSTPSVRKRTGKRRSSTKVPGPVRGPPRGEKSSKKREVKLKDTTVLGRRQKRSDSPSLFRIEVGSLQIIPRKNAGDQLMMAPGVLTTNSGGEGHAQETFMRGFAAGEGQDIEFLLDGVPLNEISNPHGHGYADLHFIPPEFVQRLDITEGAFYASQGDFAFAGTANYRLGVPERGARFTYKGGMWNTHRLLFIYAPPSEPSETFAGFEFYRTDGFGTNRAAQRATALGRYLIRDTATFRAAISIYGYAVRFDQAGVLRQDDVLAKRKGFYDTYDPLQGGESNRLLLSVDTRFGPSSSRFQMLLFTGFRTMRIKENFTGWLNDLTVEPDGTFIPLQRGDGSESRYNAFTAGSRGSYKLTLNLAKLQQSLAFGYAIRMDHGNTALLRIRPITGIPYRRILDFDFTTLNLGGWVQTQLQFNAWFTLRAGLRVDTFSFGVTHLNMPPADREGRRERDQTSQAFGFAINPRTTLDFRLREGLHLVLSYGQGTRSSETSALSDNETAPFALAQIAEVGVAYTLGKQGRGAFLKSQLSYVFTYVDQDMVFDEEYGRNTPIGASLRHAVLLGTRFNYNRWFDALLNVGYAHATRLDTGELFPYIPQLVVRADVAVNGRVSNWKVGGRPVLGRFGVGFTFVPGRPLPFREFGDPFYLLSAGASIHFWHVEIGIEARNILNLQYRQAEFNYVSNFDGPNIVPSKLLERHFAAGEPLTIMATFTFHMEDAIRQLRKKRK